MQAFDSDSSIVPKPVLMALDKMITGLPPDKIDDVIDSCKTLVSVYEREINRTQTLIDG